MGFVPTAPGRAAPGPSPGAFGSRRRGAQQLLQINHLCWETKAEKSRCSAGDESQHSEVSRGGGGVGRVGWEGRDGGGTAGRSWVDGCRAVRGLAGKIDISL